MGDASGFVGMGQAQDVLAAGYTRTSPGLAQVARLADCLQWYLHCQPMYLPSPPGQSSEVLCHHPHPYPAPQPHSTPPPPPPHLPLLHLTPVHLPPHYRHRPFPYAHSRLNQRRPVRPHHPPCTYPHQNHVLSHIRHPTPW